MEFGVLRKAPGVEAAVAQAWGEFKLASNEKEFDRPVKTWIGFVGAAMRKVQLDQDGGAGQGGYVPRGPGGGAPAGLRDGSALPVEVELDEDAAAARG